MECGESRVRRSERFVWRLPAPLALLALVLVLSPVVQADDAGLEADIKDGKRTFHIYCAECHAVGGTGGAGPNLTDEFTLHGDEYEDILRVVTNGVRDAAMPTWGQKLSKERISKVAAYVFSLKGTRPTGKKPGPKSRLTLM